MKKRYLWLAAPIILAAAMYTPRLVAGPESRTQAYFAVQRAWLAHWPFDYGKNAPTVLLPAVLPGAPVWYQVEPQVRMRLDPDDYVSRTILLNGDWEPASWQAMREHLASGSTFVDVGAQIGYYSLKAAAVVGPRGRVIAVEPNPETVTKLEGNIRASGAKAITVAPVACSDSESVLDLYAAPAANTGESSLSKTNASQAGEAQRAYKVRARPLDDIIRESGVARVDVIKVDVEGAEYLVLRGARETLAEFHPILLVELVDHQLREMGTSVAQVEGFLREQGYTGRHKVGDNVEFVFAPQVSQR